MGFRTYTCPISRRCGGCEWLAVPYPIQLRRKQEQMEELFEPVCRHDGCLVSKIAGMDDPRGYRHKAATPYAPGAKGRIRSGFYESGSHRLVYCKSCLVEDGRARPILNDVAIVAQRLRIPAYQEDRGTGVLRHAVVRIGYASGEELLTVVTNGDALPRARRFVTAIRELHPHLTSVVQNVNDRRTNAILGRRNVTLFGPGYIHDSLLGCSFEIGPTSFYQTNPQQTEVLYGLAIRAANAQPGMRVMDAYCGTGTIGICLASEARRQGVRDVRVVGVEQVGNAVECARRNVGANCLADSCEFVRDDATAFMARAQRGGERFDVVVMDPPRAGSTPEFLEGVCRLAPERVVYVSCNPFTQVRDLSILQDGGYRVTSIEPVDMFPHTKHVETVVALSRR
jgi:23S rRNA (uracil1939-C5)-methyltransferase